MSILQYLGVIHSPNLYQLFILTWSTDALGSLCPWSTFQALVTMVRKKWLRLYYSTYWCYIHQTCTNFSSWHLVMILWYHVVVGVLDLHRCWAFFNICIVNVELIPVHLVISVPWQTRQGRMYRRWGLRVTATSSRPVLLSLRRHGSPTCRLSMTQQITSGPRKCILMIP